MILPEKIALVVWAVVFLIVFPNRLYYLGLCLLLVLAAGIEALEYAPALWIPVEFVLSFQQFFNDVRDRALGRKKA